MTRRHHDPGDPELVRDLDVSDLPMFATPTSTELGIAARDQAAAKHERDIERLIPLARELAQKAGESGVTVSDLRIVAVQRGHLTGQEQGRQLSFLGAVLSRAGLEPTGRYRRSVIERSHGNLHQTYVLPTLRAPGSSVPRNAVQDGAA